MEGIEVTTLEKRYGGIQALSGVSFTAPPGTVTGFLGANGAGKTTTLRVLLGLARADAGGATIDGRRYVELDSPRRVVGAVIDGMGFDGARTGRDHLRVVTRAAGLPRTRVDEVLEFVDLTGAADRRVGGYSQGMRQRLALGTALLGDPAVLILDEPANGLDPAGVAWLRALMVDWAAQGRTVLFSSHVLAEVEFVADRIVIIDHGRVVRQGTTAELYGADRSVVVRTADADRFARLARDQGWRWRQEGRDRFVIDGPTAGEVGLMAADSGVALSELADSTSNRRLEGLFLDVTSLEVTA